MMIQCNSPLTILIFKCFIPYNIHMLRTLVNLMPTKSYSFFSQPIKQIINTLPCLAVDGWLFYVPSTERSFRDDTPIYCPLQRTQSLVFTVPSGNRTPGRRVAVHHTTAAPHQLLWQLSYE